MVQQLQAQIVQMAAMINPQIAQGAANMAQNTDEGVNNIQTNSKAIDIDKSEGSQADKMRYQAQNAATPS
jgi:hypothetical protein